MLITCVGDCGVDQYPDLTRAGGCTLNLAAHLAEQRLLDVHVVSAIGTDPLAATVLAALSTLPVSAHVRRLPGRTAVQRLALGDGERRFVGYDAGVLADFRLNERESALIATSDWTVGVVYTQIEGLVRQLVALPRRGRLAMDFMDMTDFGGSLTRIEPYLEHVHAAFFGLRLQDGPLIAAIGAWASATGRLAVVTLGPAGSLCFAGAEAARSAALPASVVDTTGAGDAFAGAFLGTWLAGGSPTAALASGSARAARVVARFGAF